MGKKNKIIRCLFSWAEGILPGSIRLYAIGANRLMVENYEAVSEMSETRMLILGRGGAVEIIGNDLVIREIRKDTLVAEGAITEILFLKRGTDV